jgi:hypothetical protein
MSGTKTCQSCHCTACITCSHPDRHSSATSSGSPPQHSRRAPDRIRATAIDDRTVTDEMVTSAGDPDLPLEATTKTSWPSQSVTGFGSRRTATLSLPNLACSQAAKVQAPCRAERPVRYLPAEYSLVCGPAGSARRERRSATSARDTFPSLPGNDDCPQTGTTACMPIRPTSAGSGETSAAGDLATQRSGNDEA